MNKDLTVGEPQSVLWKFSIPMFVSVIFQQLYNMADSVIAGKFAGEDALAAVGASYHDLHGHRGGKQHRLFRNHFPVFWRKMV